MIQKQGNWVPSWSRGTSKGAKWPVNCCFIDIKEKIFYIVSWRMMKNGYATIIRSVKNHDAGQVNLNIDGKTEYDAKLMLCIWWDQLGVVYYELLQLNESITGERYSQQLMQLSRALKQKRQDYAKRHDKMIFQHDNARSHVVKPRKR